MQLLISAFVAGAAALVVSAITPDPPEKALQGPPAGYHFRPSFQDEFEGSEVDRQKWIFAFYNPANEHPTVAKRNLYNNAEKQIYMDKDFLGLGIEPFNVKSGVLKISARPFIAIERAAILEAVAKEPADISSTPLKNVSYSSGMISSRGRFSQKYGYFEIRARWTGGKGIWPAFWLLPATGAWPPEIDVLEAHGDKPGTTFQTIHSTVRAFGSNAAKVPTADGQFHTYSVLWLPERLDFFVDDQKTVTFPTPSDMHQPMYIIANLAVGGKWPGDPDTHTPFPANIEIDYVRAWEIKIPSPNK